MKRLVAASASILALLMAGTAAGGVPEPVRKAEGVPTEATEFLGRRTGEALRKAGLVARKSLAPAPTPAAGSPSAARPSAATTSASTAGTEETSASGSAAAPASGEATPAAAEPQAEGTETAGTSFFPGLAGTGHAGYASGSVIHADALQSSGTRVVNADVAFSGASFTSEKLTGAVANEMSRIVAPALDAGAAFGRGSGLEAGVVIDESEENQIVLPELVEAKAPPSTTLISRDLIPAELDPLLDATILRGQAKSLGAAACTTGVDLSFGLGHVVDLSLLETAADAGHILVTEVPEGLEEAVSQSRSATRLVAQTGTKGVIQKLGLQSEVRQTIAPVTFFEGTEQQFTIQLLGEWVLRATADGKEGSVFYGPGTVEPETPVLQILDAAGEITTQVTTQDFFGDEGLNIDIPGVAEIAIGEDPRAIGGSTETKPTETPTAASAAVDVVRVRLLAQGEDFRAADVRIGHLEAAVAVPEGGITCGIGLTKDAVPRDVKAGDTFKWVINVTNPNDCLLTKIKLVDNITVTNGVKYAVKSSTPKADSLSDSQLVFNDVGPLARGKAKEVTIDVSVLPDSSAGSFTDEALVTGVCGPTPLEGEATTGAGAGLGASIPLEARVSLNFPRVAAVRAAAAEVPAPLVLPILPRTGSDLFTPVPLALLGVGTGLLLRRVSRKRRP